MADLVLIRLTDRCLFARVDLEGAGITVSTMYPFLTDIDTEFVESIRAGKEASRQLSSGGLQPQSPGLVAEGILDLIQTGAEQADLVPEQFGGSYKG